MNERDNGICHAAMILRAELGEGNEAVFQVVIEDLYGNDLSKSLPQHLRSVIGW